jgi:hypothetical protein
MSENYFTKKFKLLSEVLIYDLYYCLIVHNALQKYFFI